MEIARTSNSNTKAPLVIGSDKNYIRVACFSDKNSNFNCHQLVIMQTGRIRAVHADPIKPWAQEINGQAWLSLIFYQIPLPGRILSVAIYPVNQLRSALVDNDDYVKELIAQGLLKLRPDAVIDPYSFDFPDLID